MDIDEEDEEVRKEERAQRLGIRPGSQYLNMAVDCQVTWPKEETVVEFDGYLWRTCRCAVAHANKPYSTDPDNFHELRRLYMATNVLRALARLFIKNELGVSDCVYDGT